MSTPPDGFPGSLTPAPGLAPGPTVRPEVADLPAYVPGARRKPGTAVHKLSSNENPYPPLPSVLARITEGAADINRYPDLAATDLTEALAAALDSEARALGISSAAAPAVTPAHVALGNGSVAVLAHVLAAVVQPGDEVVYPWRSFEAYPITVAVAGGISVQVPLRANGALDLDALAAAVTERTRVLVVCTPNNPTGPAVAHQELCALLARVPRRVLVLLDEAYLEFVRQKDAVRGLEVLAEYPNVVLLRTFSKAYGLAGLRVGFAVATPEIAVALRAVATPFGVSSVAQRAAVASLEAQHELLDRVERVVRERERVVAALEAQGWTLPEAQGNFVWFPLGERTLDFAQAARESGVLVRPFAGEGVRVSIGDEEANDTFLAFTAAYRTPVSTGAPGHAPARPDGATTSAGTAGPGGVPSPNGCPPS